MTKTKHPKTATGSVVPAEFRQRYGASGSCDDTTARKLAKATRGKDGKPDPAKLRKVAEANGVWRAEYDKLNPGLARMTVGNRLRKLPRDGVAIKWGR